MNDLITVIGWLASQGYLWYIAGIFVMVGLLPISIYMWYFMRNCPYCRSIYEAKRKNRVLGVFIGRDGYVRLYPMKSDGNIATPTWGPLKGKPFIIKSKSIKKLGPINTAILLTDYSFPIEPKYAVAIAKLKKFFKSVEEFITGIKVNKERDTLEAELQQIRKLLDAASRGEIEVDDETLKNLRERAEELESLLKNTPEVGKVKVCSEYVDPEEIHDYLVYDHSPAFIEEYATARENEAYLRATKAWKEFKWMGLIIALAIIIIVSALAYAIITSQNSQQIIVHIPSLNQTVTVTPTGG